jgi:hypothetical protein
MSSKEKRIKARRGQKKSTLPFKRENYYLFGAGLLIIILGYIALSRGPWNSFWSLTLAPILLVLGYCIVIPVAILYRKKAPKQEEKSS